MSVTISEAVKYIGVDDKTIDLFESQYVVPHGVSYNSYLILDEKVALMDTVDTRGVEQWEKNLLAALDGRKVDYLIVSHLEPDHAGSIGRLVELFPEVTLVGNAKTFQMLPQFFDELPVDENHKITVAAGSPFISHWNSGGTSSGIWNRRGTDTGCHGTDDLHDDGYKIACVGICGSSTFFTGHRIFILQ